MDEAEEPPKSRDEKPGLLKRVETTFCTPKTVRIVVAIKFTIALVTCVVVFSQIIDSTEYLVSHYCMLNYFEKKYLGREDIIELHHDSSIADTTLCHSSIALPFSLEDTRVPVNTSAGLLAALCLLTCLAAPAAVCGLRHYRPIPVLAWFVVTAFRAAVVTTAAAVFVALGWARYTALTRHQVALFMTHLGCALLDVLTDLPALMLYKSMKAPAREGERVGELQDVAGTEEGVAGGSGGVSSGCNAVGVLVPSIVTVGPEGEGKSGVRETPADVTAEALGGTCETSGEAERSSSSHVTRQASPQGEKDKDCGRNSQSRIPKKTTADADEIISDTEHNASKSQSAHADDVEKASKSQPEKNHEREYGGTVLVFHEA